jgi:hexulose-6-phosphate isomerase
MYPNIRNRRQFIGEHTWKLAQLALATSVISSARPAAASGLKGRIRKAVKFQMINEKLSTEDKLRMLRDVGFDGVEVASTQHGTSAALAVELAKASQKLGFPIHGVINSSKPNLIGAIDEAANYGATSILHVVRYDTKLPYLQNYRETQEIILRAVEHAEKKQIMILLENVWASFLIEPLGMARYLDELNSPWVHSYFDIGNVVRWGWPQHWIEVLGQRVKKLDVKEYDLDVAMNRGMRAAFDVPIGQGSIEWDKVRAELVKLDYQGWATAEVRGGDRRRMAEISEQMDRVFALSAN